MKQQFERSPSESYFWPVVLAVVLHVLIFAMLFVSWAFAPELPPSKPIVQATLYQLKSKSQATTQTNQKIAGEAKKTASKQYEVEQLEQKKLEQQKLEQQKLEQQQVAAAKAAEQKKADEARKAEAQKAAEAKKADEAKKAAEAKAAEQKKQADIAKKRAEDEAKKKAAEDAKKKAAEDAKKKAAEEAKKKAAAAARKAAEDKKARALAELLSDTTERQQALADEVGSEVTGSLDDLIVNLVSQQWRRPPSARNGMSVEVLIEMLPDGTITNASVSRSSGDKPFDSSAVAAVRNVGRIPEMQQLPRATFDSLYRQRRIIFKPEDLSL